MRKTILATLIALSATSALAGPGGMATNTELSHEATSRREADVVLNDKIKASNVQIGKLWDRTVELNSYDNGNSVAIKALAAKTDATNADLANTTIVAQDAYNKATNAQNQADTAVGIGQNATNKAIEARAQADEGVRLAQEAGNRAAEARAQADVGVTLAQDANNAAYNAQQSANAGIAIGQAAGNAAINAQNTADVAVRQGQANANGLINANNRIDTVAAQGNQTATRVGAVERTTAQHGATLANHETRISSNTASIQQLGARADDADLALIGVQQVNQRQDIRLSSHDAALARQDQINEALSTSVAGLYTDMSGLRSEVRKASREAKEAKAGAAVALAVAGQQMCTLRECGFQTSVSAATMSGYQALAVGFGGAVTDRVFINGAISKSSSTTGAVISGTYQW